jgi:hypothetical protein
MPADLTAERASDARLRSVPEPGRSARIRAELLSRFPWTAEVRSVARPLHDLASVMDLTKLLNIAAAVNTRNELAFAIMSKEYIRTGLNWIYAMNRIGLSNFIILAGDQITADLLDERGVPNVLAVIDESGFDPVFVSTSGFPAKGGAVSAFKLPGARLLASAGYNVVLSDADAVWLRDAMPFLRGADVSFQRIGYHPRAISGLWGFAACGGFIAFRGGTRTVAFLDRCIDENRLLLCDQVAINLALLDSQPEWRCEHPDWRVPGDGASHEISDREVAFAKFARYGITGELRRDGVRVLALPHDQFWRHEIVKTPVSDMVVCHPNSPKDDLGKTKIFDGMGIRFDAAAST